MLLSSVRFLGRDFPNRHYHRADNLHPPNLYHQACPGLFPEENDRGRCICISHIVRKDMPSNYLTARCLEAQTDLKVNLV